jgi:hypothetical protein
MFAGFLEIYTSKQNHPNKKHLQTTDHITMNKTLPLQIVQARCNTKKNVGNDRFRQQELADKLVKTSSITIQHDQVKAILHISKQHEKNNNKTKSANLVGERFHQMNNVLVIAHFHHLNLFKQVNS